MKKRTVTFLTGLQIEASLADKYDRTDCVVSNLPYFSIFGPFDIKSPLDKPPENPFVCY